MLIYERHCGLTHYLKYGIVEPGLGHYLMTTLIIQEAVMTNDDRARLDKFLDLFQRRLWV